MRRRRTTILTAALLALVAVLVSGCALDVAPTAASGSGTGTAATNSDKPPAVTHNEVSTPPGPDEHAVAHSSAPAAIRAFAFTYVNWDAADVRARLEALAAASVGQARSAMQLAASQTGSDTELTRAGIANHGSVEAVSHLDGSADRYVVVTRERTTATSSSAYQGLEPAWHLTLATVERRAAGWVVSGWQPEN